MGSGSSKGNGQTATTRAQPVTVANVNNNTPEKVISVESNSVTRAEPERVNTTPSKSPVKQSGSGKSQTKSVIKGKFTGKVDWNDSDDDDDDWEEFLGAKPISTTVSKTNLTHQNTSNQNERDLNSYNNNNPPQEEHYPESYAQRHTREQYTFGKDRLIREKTIYRNPHEWGVDEEEEEEEVNKKPYHHDRITSETPVQTSGFDASKFRQVNQGQSARDKEIFTPRVDDIIVPQYNTASEPEPEQPYQPFSHKTLSRIIPQYTDEEEDLMRELMGEGGGNSDSDSGKKLPTSKRLPQFEIQHQAMHQSNSRKSRLTHDNDDDFFQHQGVDVMRF